MFMFWHQTTGQTHYIGVYDDSSEYVANLKYLETTPANQNCVHEGIKKEQTKFGQWLLPYS
jgi:hypothetical protein